MPVIAVLWGLGLLTAIALSLIWHGNMSRSLVHNSLRAAGSHATIEAAVHRAVAALLDPRPERRWRTDGMAESFEFNGTPIKVSIQDELGRIDLNQAEEPTLSDCSARPALMNMRLRALPTKSWIGARRRR